MYWISKKCYSYDRPKSVLSMGMLTNVKIRIIVHKAKGIFTVPTLQKSIEDITSWVTTWQLKLAINKCQHIHISLAGTAVLPKFSLNGNMLFVMS